ncbi:MAG: low molecular weight protein-tyrosine-phosphatase [Egibacteraceae bacterium]
MRILLVCLGNYCRSPTAEAAVRKAAAEAGLDIEVDSAGTGEWHIGHPPDPRMTTAAAAAGLTLGGRGRLVTPEDFERFDLLAVMDKSNLADVRALAPDEAGVAKVVLFRSFDPEATADEVPDPYYGGPDGFAEVVEIVRSAARGLVEHLRSRQGA